MSAKLGIKGDSGLTLMNNASLFFLFLFVFLSSSLPFFGSTERLDIGNERWKTMHMNTYSGYENGKTIIVQGNYVVLQFSSGPWRTTFRNLGFRIFFTAVPFGKYNTTSVASLG